MKTIFASIFGILLCTNSIVHPAFAHVKGHAEGEEHPVKKLIESSEAKAIAINKVNELTEKGTIDKSWLNAKHIKTEKKKFKKRTDWVVTLKRDDNSKILYIFIDLYGKYLAANFTGK